MVHITVEIHFHLLSSLSLVTDLNRRPDHYKWPALPTELTRLFLENRRWGSGHLFLWLAFLAYLLAPLNPNQPIYYFLLLCLKAEPARVFVVLLDFLLLKALLAFFATLLDVLGALAIVQSFGCERGNRTPGLKVMSLPSYRCSISRCLFYKDMKIIRIFQIFLLLYTYISQIK